MKQLILEFFRHLVEFEYTSYADGCFSNKEDMGLGQPDQCYGDHSKSQMCDHCPHYIHSR